MEKQVGKKWHPYTTTPDALPVLEMFIGEYEIVEFTDTNEVELVPVSRLVLYGSASRIISDLLQRKKAVLVGYAAELYGVEDIFSEIYVPNQVVFVLTVGAGSAGCVLANRLSEDLVSRVLIVEAGGYHGRGGPLVVSSGVATSLSHKVYRRGFCYGRETVSKGDRWSTAIAFLRPAMNRPNLHVSIDSYVTKILIENKKAAGISFIKDNVKHVVKANKEVIISGGAVNSPQLLMLSGIGPKKHLSALKIPVEADLPVGNNLEDHTMLFLLFRDNSSSGSSPSMWSHLQYQLFRSGPFAKTHLEADAFFGNDKIEPPYFQGTFYSVPAVSSFAHEFPKMENLNPKPKSRGTIRLQSTDPFDPPLIDPNYLDHPDDITNFLKGIQEMMRLANTTAFRSVGASPSDPYQE
uniref:L-sorbose 1-dehydrogenase n=1 Tax=Magallana gigas TaxID=29159 RepID=K1RLQ5_MAGGI